MFFGASPKKKGKEAGEILWQQLSMAFLAMENLPLGGFNLPSDFFDDEYTLEYTVVFVETLRTHHFSGQNWSPIKCLEFREAAYSEVEPSGGLLKKVAALGEKVVSVGKTEKSETQIQAADAAYGTIGVLYGFVSSDDSNPVVSDAKFLAEMMSRSRPNDPFQVVHASCITTNTISTRTKERYGERYNPNW